jgi:hypothetical protein
VVAVTVVVVVAVIVVVVVPVIVVVVPVIMVVVVPVKFQNANTIYSYHSSINVFAHGYGMLRPTQTDSVVALSGTSPCATAFLPN